MALDEAGCLFVFYDARQCAAPGVAQEVGQLLLVLHVREREFYYSIQPELAFEVLHVIIVICKVDVQPAARWSENQASLTKGICLTSGQVWCRLAHMWSSNPPPK